MTRAAFLTLSISLAASIAFEQSSRPSAAAPTTAPATIMATPAKEKFHVYLLMGQSNMVGRDTRTLGSQADHPRVLALTGDGQWLIARDPIHAQEGRIAAGVGPGISFARAMADADENITIGIVPCAVGGTSLKRWVKGADLYEKAIARAKAAAEVGLIKGVLWHQGETDTTNEKSAATYEVRLTQMFSDLRQDLGQPDLRIVVGQLGEFLPAEKHPYADAVRAGIRHIPLVVPNVGYADSAGLGDKGDKLHFDAAAEATLGTRYAEAMQRLQK